ncbi:hypothetical protein VNO78_08073 [Psophocarpus tetragonolobus]|uniref:Uncharacterized protein n=1 Tax=Psophocarpus tetragonolobus TaxID=3891 RepID=A0AAN9XS96_PSOTE
MYTEKDYPFDWNFANNPALLITWVTTSSICFFLKTEGRRDVFYFDENKKETEPSGPSLINKVVLRADELDLHVYHVANCYQKCWAKFINHMMTLTNKLKAFAFRTFNRPSQATCTATPIPQTTQFYCKNLNNSACADPLHPTNKSQKTSPRVASNPISPFGVTRLI